MKNQPNSNNNNSLHKKSPNSSFKTYYSHYYPDDINTQTYSKSSITLNPGKENDTLYPSWDSGI